jgi:hypothetical protein
MVVSDLHLRILRRVANRAEAALDDHDAGGTASQARRGELAGVPAHARGRVVAAQARRRRVSQFTLPGPTPNGEP